MNAVWILWCFVCLGSAWLTLRLAGRASSRLTKILEVALMLFPIALKAAVWSLVFFVW